MNTKVRLLSFAAFLVLLAVGCSHASYKPEVGDANSIQAHGGVVYPVPATNPQLKMKLVSAPELKTHTLHVRMYFKLVNPKLKATLDPMSQRLILPDGGPELKPSRVYASSKAKPLIDLSGREKQAVELVYSLPAGGKDYPYFQFHWSIAFGAGRSETEVVRFDREVKTIQEGPAQAQELQGDFPYSDALGLFGPQWIGDDFGWWDGGV